MSSPRLSVAIFTRNQAPILDAVLASVAPLCASRGVPIVVSDNASTDDTAAVCARHVATGALRLVRRDAEVSLDESVMSALDASDADYTWLCWDDDFLLPAGVDAVLAALAKASPTALLTTTTTVARGTTLDLSKPLAPQLAPTIASAKPGAARSFTRASELFSQRFYGLPIPSVVYPTATVRKTDYRRYFGTFHPHIGALYDALAAEERRLGAVDVVELPELCAVSLVPVGERGKAQWTAHFDEIATRALPAWLDLLPDTYAADLPAARAYHAHLFRAVLDRRGA